MHALLRDTREVWSAAFSPGGTQIITAGVDRTARIWSATTGQVIAKLEGHSRALSTAAFSPDGERVVTASGDGTAIIFRIVMRDDIERLLTSK